MNESESNFQKPFDPIILLNYLGFNSISFISEVFWYFNENVKHDKHGKGDYQ